LLGILDMFSLAFVTSWLINLDDRKLIARFCE